MTQPESAVIVEPFPRVTWSAAKYEKVVRFSATDVLFYRVSGRDSLESRAMERIYTRIVEMGLFPAATVRCYGGHRRSYRCLSRGWFAGAGWRLPCWRWVTAMCTGPRWVAVICTDPRVGRYRGPCTVPDPERVAISHLAQHLKHLDPALSECLFRVPIQRTPWGSSSSAPLRSVPF